MSGCGPGVARCQLVRESTSWAPSTVFFMSCPNHAKRHIAVDKLVEALGKLADSVVETDALAHCSKNHPLCLAYNEAAALLNKVGGRAAGEVEDD